MYAPLAFHTPYLLGANPSHNKRHLRTLLSCYLGSRHKRRVALEFRQRTVGQFKRKMADQDEEYSLDPQIEGD